MLKVGHRQLAFMLGAIEDAVGARHTSPGSVLERPAQEMQGVFGRDLHENGLLDADEFGMLERPALGSGCR